MPPEYAFFTRWRVKGTAEDVFDVLEDPLALPRWWPSVYLKVKELKPGDPVSKVGRVIDLYTKGWLPYTLRWNFTVTESRRPSGFRLVAHGDFEGTGVWTIAQAGESTEATYDWRISAEKPLLRYGSFVFRPLFAANHRWAMARGEESLDLELRRRRGESVPDPPGPTFTRR
ncbi:MAG TPA: SRPBCC family protein [Candidatus Dormibacteraeota bacterium]|nr:SRPBCC family protein [Candidatus Dormibacteraeota bacterium]